MDIREERDKLREELDRIKSSSFFEPYIALKKQLEHWAKEIRSNPIDLVSGKNDDADFRAFDKADKYFTKIKEYYSQLDYLKSRLTPEEVKQEGTSAVDNIREVIASERRSNSSGEIPRD